MAQRTEQEEFWAGEFGNAYTERNAESFIAANIAFFSKILSLTGPIKSVIEFGANVGNNLKAIRTLSPQIDLTAVEINAMAVDELRKIHGLDVFHGSIAAYYAERPADLVLFKGVLIHVNPDDLASAYEKAFAASRRFICLAEYYNPSPVEVPYRGHAQRLFKRDFAGEMLDRFPLRLVNYGFVYHRDATFPQDDMTWFLLERPH